MQKLAEKKDLRLKAHRWPATAPTKNPFVKKHSLDKSEKLLKPEEFSRVRQHGQKRSTENYTAYLLSTELKRSRLGISVSARVANAVRRNRIKRLLREFFRLNKEKLPSSTDVLITAKTKAGAGSYSEAEKELRRLLTARKA